MCLSKLATLCLDIFLSPYHQDCVVGRKGAKRKGFFVNGSKIPGVPELRAKRFNVFGGYLVMQEMPKIDQFATDLRFPWTIVGT